MRGRSVNPSYRSIPAALEPGSTFFLGGDTSPAIDADATGYADSQVNEIMGTSWAIATERFGDSSIRVGVLRTVATIRTDSALPYSPTPVGSLLAKMRTRGTIRTGP